MPAAVLSAPELMREFYRLRDVEKRDKAEALRGAQLKATRGGPGAGGPGRRPAAGGQRLTALSAAGESTLGSSFREGPQREGGGFSYPFDWAPFAVMGSWRQKGHPEAGHPAGCGAAPHPASPGDAAGGRLRPQGGPVGPSVAGTDIPQPKLKKYRILSDNSKGLALIIKSLVPPGTLKLRRSHPGKGGVFKVRQPHDAAPAVPSAPGRRRRGLSPDDCGSGASP
jgi:hypothetical protein